MGALTTEQEIRQAERRSLEATRWRAAASVEDASRQYSLIAAHRATTPGEREAALAIVQALQGALSASDRLGASLRVGEES